MKSNTKFAALGIASCAMFAGAADAAVVLVGDPTPLVQAADMIAVSTTWTANNTYNLQDQIYVMPGATLTIEAGTVIASNPAPNGRAGIAVTRGAKIIAIGTQAEPIIFTSTADVATWDVDASHPTGKDPKTGVWREAALEWGNVTIMGRAYVSEWVIAGNTPTPNANNVALMEGLVGEVENDPNVLYGGGDDNDDSGAMQYCSLRYGGRVPEIQIELNGLSLGGIGRETDISHIEIMNNVDDGIEIWGGTVNLKYVSIWNIGDDSFDIDQGWRGKAQFGLIVQGHSLDAAQGSGVGDNLLEMDGAEQSDYQPVTTATLYNFTAIGQPVPGAGDHGTAWRDNARVQIRNSIFMDLGDRLVSFDNLDGDGNLGYGLNGTLSWANTWTTDYTVFSLVNAPAMPALFYTAQSAGNAAIGQGKLAEITDSVFFRNLAAAAYTEANARGVTVAGGSNPAKGNVVATYVPATPNANMPIAALTRGAPVVKGGLTMLPVISIDPRPANDALVSVSSAPNDGFFTPANYRGAFAPNENWLCGWTAADAFGFNVAPPGGCVIGLPCPADISGDSTVGVPDLLAVINAWGPCAGCPADIAPAGGDGTVGVPDLLAVINAWGACP